ncbi:DUF6250 domain-containing protein [Ruficoccus sp. ZRK36]|uniref:DUF6250 domain-containing protein n=1 Tax=Ruficoccus sp. ZRK36 TaxID=2866311 RepID=UPI001C73BADD|nr:DUF6250 domain-containing protein [Ruficoccus sp. ZRK36]QYY35230.1 YesU family protein [Ruficoccus sp. ZRK36]
MMLKTTSILILAAFAAALSFTPVYALSPASGDAEAPACVRPILADEHLSLKWMVDEDFSKGEWSGRWTSESQGAQIETAEGGLKISTPPENPKKLGTTVWLNEKLPADVLIHINVKTLTTGDFNACNLNLFLHAKEADGSDLVFGRSGAYPDYHQIPNYIFTFVGGDMKGWARVRRDPGFNKIAESDARTARGKDYQITVLKVDGRLRYWVDGQLIHDVTDPEPLDGGQFGLRTWASDIVWEKVEIAAVVSES